jgi:hypothetical protein
MRRCIPAALAALVLLSATGCDLFFPFRRNPKLRLLRDERMTGLSLIHPVVSPDGAQVYYLGVQDPYNIHFPYGSLWRVGFNDTCAVQVLPDIFVAMAISPDGRTMVLGGGPSHRLVTIELGTFAAETIPSALDIDAKDVEFSRTVAGRVCFTDRTGLRRVDIDGSNEALVDSTVRDYFDLTASDSVVQTWLSKPEVSPDGRYLACVVSHDKTNHTACDIAVVDLVTGDTAWLKANPYDPAAMVFPYWTPDGRALVFAAAQWRGESGGTYPAELWVIDDVLRGGK